MLLTVCSCHVTSCSPSDFAPASSKEFLDIQATIECSMIYLYIKPEVKKHDATAMITAVNETCIGGLYENDYLVSGIFLMREMSNLLVSSSDSTPNLQGFP